MVRVKQGAYTVVKHGPPAYIHVVCRFNHCPSVSHTPDLDQVSLLEARALAHQLLTVPATARGTEHMRGGVANIPVPREHVGNEVGVVSRWPPPLSGGRLRT